MQLDSVAQIITEYILLQQLERSRGGLESYYFAGLPYFFGEEARESAYVRSYVYDRGAWCNQPIHYGALNQIERICIVGFGHMHA